MKRQRGVVLLLALVLSLLLGLLAASALREALVETRMAGYMRDGLLAFEEAEAALQAGEGARAGTSRSVYRVLAASSTARSGRAMAGHTERLLPCTEPGHEHLRCAYAG